MKRRFLECAVLLGIMMSVMFLAQTQEGVSHVLKLPPHPNTGIVSADPNHTDSDHLPCDVGPDWDPDKDPDPRAFSDCGVGPNNSKGHKTSWALHYYGGKLAGNESMYPVNPNNRNDKSQWQCQMRFYLKVDVSVSANSTTCSASVTPSISPLPAVPVDETPTYNGKANVDLLISGVCYHDDVGHHGFGWFNPTCGRCWNFGSPLGIVGGHCEWEYREKKELNIHGPDGEGAWIGVDVLSSSDSYTRSLTAGVDYEVTEGLNLNVNYSESKTSEVSGHKGIIYGIDVSIGGVEFFDIIRKGNAVIEKQTKTATASGRVQDASAQEIKAEYDGVDLHRCPPYDCRSGKCPPRMP